MIALLILFQAKHFVFDFLYQPPWQYKNKGTFGHPGGIAHAVQHGLATWAILVFAVPEFCFDSFNFCIVPGALTLSLIETVIHYFVDLSKMKLNAALGWGPTTTDNFWRLLGFDQFLHQITYVWIIWFVSNH